MHSIAQQKTSQKCRNNYSVSVEQLEMQKLHVNNCRILYILVFLNTISRLFSYPFYLRVKCFLFLCYSLVNKVERITKGQLETTRLILKCHLFIALRQVFVRRRFIPTQNNILYAQNKLIDWVIKNSFYSQLFMVSFNCNKCKKTVVL